MPMTGKLPLLTLMPPLPVVQPLEAAVKVMADPPNVAVMVLLVAKPLPETVMEVDPETPKLWLRTMLVLTVKVAVGCLLPALTLTVCPPLGEMGTVKAQPAPV